MDVESEILKQISAERYSSGEAISARLKITRSAVWKHIDKLRSQGYTIEASPRHGYRLAGRPDKLLPLEIGPGLNTKIVGSRIFHLEETGSTADEARKLIEKGTVEGTVVLAESQKAGRGRMDRKWVTPPGKAIAMSVVLYTGLKPAQAPLLSLATAVAAARAVETVAGVRVELKWPNDIFLAGKKIGGVLVEMAAELDRVRWIIDSIGINVNNTFKGTPLEDTAASIYEVRGEEASRKELVVRLLEELDGIWAQGGAAGGLEPYREEFEELDLLQGREVEVKTPEGIISGRAVGISADGRLRLQRADGEMFELFSGEASISSI